MKDCIFCKKSGAGVICRHCLAKGGSKTGKIGKSAGKVISMAILVLLAGKNYKNKRGSD